MIKRNLKGMIERKESVKNLIDMLNYHIREYERELAVLDERIEKAMKDDVATTSAN